MGGAVARVHQQVAGLLGHPSPGRMGGDPGDMHAATPVLDDHQDVEAAQEDVSTWATSIARIVWAWSVRNCRTLAPSRGE